MLWKRVIWREMRRWGGGVTDCVADCLDADLCSFQRGGHRVRDRP